MDRATQSNDTFEVGPLKNPWNLAEGEACYRIAIDHDNRLNRPESKPYRAAIAVPFRVADYHPNKLEGAATQAYLWAKDEDGLEAGMMAFCAFYYYDDTAQGWVYFL